MPTKIGRIKKPSVEESKGKRKLYCVPLLFSINKAAQDYERMLDQYWHQVEEHVGNLEKAGKPDKMYHEMVSSTGKEGLQAIQRQDERTYRFVKSRFDQGASLEALEDEKLFTEYMDWGMCLAIVRSPDVVKRILEFYRDAEKKRDEHIAGRINETLNEGKAAILVMRDENRIRIQPRFSPDIQVFLVRPRVLSDIQRWLRDQATQAVDEAKS